AWEGGIPALDVTLSAASGKPVTVHYQATGGTASSGLDYNLAVGDLTFAPGEIKKQVPLALIDDQLQEPNETVVVTLTNPTNAVLGTNKVHTLTILDNDPVPLAGFHVDSAGGIEKSAVV